jgi:hypothetical protein
LGPVFMFCASGLVFGGTEGVASRFYVLRARTRFRRYRGRRVPFSCFAGPESFSAVLRASGVVFMFYAPRLVVSGVECLGSRFPVLRARTRFQRCRVRPVHFSCFALLDSFSAVPRSSGPVFMFCALRLVLGGTEGVGFLFHVLRFRTHFRRYRGRLVPFSCFAGPESFSAVPRASGPVFMCCAPGLVFGCTVGVGSRYHVLCARTRFLLYCGRRVPFSCFALPDSFSAVSSVSNTYFMLCVPGLIFDGTEGVMSRFHVLRALTHFRRFRGRRVPFSCFSGPDSFSAVPTTSGPVFMFCAPGLVFGSTEGVDSTFNALRSRTCFQRDRGRRVPFSCFACPDSFSVVPRAWGPVFMFCDHGFVFGGVECVGSLFLVLRARTRYRL